MAGHNNMQACVAGLQRSGVSKKDAMERCHASGGKMEEALLAHRKGHKKKKKRTSPTVS